MRVASLFLTLTLVFCYSGFARAAETHEILLGPRDRYDLVETEQWRFEVQREAAGRFADVQVSPKRGDALMLALYFIADTADQARLDTPEKVASSVLAGTERFLPLTVEKKIKLQALTLRNSFGSLAVLTEANPQSAPGGFKYQTRGMVRLSPDAALGFSLLSRELNTASYRQALNYVYSFIKLAPTAIAVTTPAPAPALNPAPILSPTPAARPAVTPTPQAQPVPVPPIVAKPAAAPAKPAQRGPQRDMRDCLTLPTDAEVMRCAAGKR